MFSNLKIICFLSLYFPHIWHDFILTWKNKIFKFDKNSDFSGAFKIKFKPKKTKNQTYNFI